MSFAPLHSLRHRPTRRVVTVLAALALLVAGFAQASHYHKYEPARGAQTHLQCLLCLHVDRWAGAPALPAACASAGGVHTLIAGRPFRFESHNCFHCYDARGPPLI